MKFGGHITSITRSTQLSNPNGEFYFHLSQANEDLSLHNDKAQVTKHAILSAEIERQENRYRKVIKGQRTTLIEKKMINRDYQWTLQQKEVERLEQEQQRRERDVLTQQDKYYDPEAYEDPHFYYHAKSMPQPRFSAGGPSS